MPTKKRQASSVKRKVEKEPKTVKKEAVKKTVVKKQTAVRLQSTAVVGSQKAESKNLSVTLFDIAGKSKGTVKLPEDVFGGKINKVLMAQAVRVYLANQRMGASVTKTRGQVDGSTRKIYRQKGTGRARHGGIRAPIFVGGGTAHGPKLRDYSLDMPVKMRKAAVVSALSAMAKDGNVMVVAGFTELAKTKAAAAALVAMGLQKRKALVVMPEHMNSVFRAVRNIDRVGVIRSSALNTYEVLNAGVVVVMQEALVVLEKQFKKENK